MFLVLYNDFQKGYDTEATEIVEKNLYLCVLCDLCGLISLQDAVGFWSLL